MDFDDLDEEAEKRIADGEAVEGHIVVNSQPPKGTVLPPIARSARVPSDEMLPHKIQKLMPPYYGDLKERKPKLRLLCMMGAGDNCCQEWCHMAHDAPVEIEMATHEPKGHGTRVHSNPYNTLQEMGDDAFEGFRDAMSTGAFVLLGHSIGCLTATYVAKRAKEELNVEPLGMIVLERGAPNRHAFSDFGLDMLRKDPMRFLRIRNPETIRPIEAGESHVLRMYSNDLQLENDTRPVGWYKFPCPILAFRCPAPLLKDAPKEFLEGYKPMLEIHSERDFIGHMGEQWFEDWNLWTDHPDGVTIYEISDTDHNSIKKHPVVRKAIWKALSLLVKTMK